MSPKKLFLQWSLTVSLITVGIVIAALLGWLGKFYTLDVTKLSVVIAMLFAAATAWCGRLSWRVDAALESKQLQELAEETGQTAARRKKFDGFLKETANQAEHGWFAVDLCEKLGLVGTVAGFVIMLWNGFGGFTPGDQAGIQQLLDRLSSGMSTAFITTLVGVVCGILLRIQFHQLDRSLERLRP